MVSSQYLIIRKQQCGPRSEGSIWRCQGYLKVHSSVALNPCPAVGPCLQASALAFGFCPSTDHCPAKDHWLWFLTPRVCELKIPGPVCYFFYKVPFLLGAYQIRQQGWIDILILFIVFFLHFNFNLSVKFLLIVTSVSICAFLFFECALKNNFFSMILFFWECFMFSWGNFEVAFFLWHALSRLSVSEFPLSFLFLFVCFCFCLACWDCLPFPLVKAAGCQFMRNVLQADWHLFLPGCLVSW